MCVRESVCVFVFVFVDMYGIVMSVCVGSFSCVRLHSLFCSLCACVCMCVCACVRVCVCVCVCEREREKERESVCVCVCT